MNQPDLGNYISNLRKEQGLTQEELVDKCNINVRTIQRIEAGEVTPRSYTIKNILEALGSSFDEVFKKENTSPEFEINLNRKYLIYTFISGIIYFITSTLEIIADSTFSLSSERFLTPIIYLIIKSISLITGTIFFYGSFLIGKAYKSQLIIVVSSFFIGLSLILGTIDGFIYMHEIDAHTGYYIGRLVIFGLLYVFLGTGYFFKRDELGRLTKWLGLSGIIGGICLVTIILIIPGAILYSAFEILLMILMYQLWSKKA